MAKAALSAYRIELLGDQHDRGAFACGVEELDRYFRTQAGQDSRKRVATCFAAVGPDDSVAGFYTLAATSISLVELPAELSKKLPRYPAIPATLLGRLAVDRRHRARGLGELLLLDAFSRTLRGEIASYAFVVDAKTESARVFYEQYGFRPLSSAVRRLFMPLGEIAASFS